MVTSPATSAPAADCWVRPVHSCLGRPSLCSRRRCLSRHAVDLMLLDCQCRLRHLASFAATAVSCSRFEVDQEILSQRTNRRGRALIQTLGQRAFKDGQECKVICRAHRLLCPFGLSHDEEWQQRSGGWAPAAADTPIMEGVALSAIVRSLLAAMRLCLNHLLHRRMQLSLGAHGRRVVVGKR